MIVQCNGYKVFMKTLNKYTWEMEKNRNHVSKFLSHYALYTLFHL